MKINQVYGSGDGGGDRENNGDNFPTWFGDGGGDKEKGGGNPPIGFGGGGD